MPESSLKAVVGGGRNHKQKHEIRMRVLKNLIRANCPNQVWRRGGLVELFAVYYDLELPRPPFALKGSFGSIHLA